MAGERRTDNLGEELRIMEAKLHTLKLDYERYFMGTRPREPVLLRQEIQKTIVYYSNTAIQNTALRFKFNSINSRYQAFKRQWDNVLRQMEAGTYRRDVFRANLRQKQGAESGAGARKRDTGVASADAGAGLFDAYRDAARACGQNVKGLTPQRLQKVVDKQTAALREKLGCREVRFRVAVKDGKVKLKAAPIRD